MLTRCKSALRVIAQAQAIIAGDFATANFLAGTIYYPSGPVDCCSNLLNKKNAYIRRCIDQGASLLYL